MNYQKGDIIICVNDKILPKNDCKPDIKEGNEYPANSIFECGCGEKHVDVGVKPTVQTVTCYKCREQLPKAGTVHWAHASRFVKR